MERPIAFDPAAFVQFSAAGRSVTHLYGSAQTDVLLVCWEPGQESSYHDHGESEAITLMLEGSITANPGTPEAVVAGPGQLLITPRGVKHKLVNHTAARAVGLHLYTPPLQSARPPSPPFRDARAEILESRGRR